MSDPFDDLLGTPLQAEPGPTELAATPAPEVPVVEPAFGVGDSTNTEATQEPEPQSGTQPGPVEPDVERTSPTEPAEAPPAPQPAPAEPANEAPGPDNVADIVSRPDRSESMKRRHKGALDAVFGREGAQFEVVKEVHLPEGQKFKTPFGNSGRHGWVIKDVNTGEAHTIGANALKIGVNDYKVITPLPPKPRGRKPKATEPVAEAAQAE